MLFGLFAFASDNGLPILKVEDWNGPAGPSAISVTRSFQMATIVESIEISRRPEDVFLYATEFSHFPEWQGGVVSARREGDAPLKAVVTRRVGPRKLQRTEEIAELNPPRTWTVRGVGGPLTAIAKGTVEPLDNGKRSRVTIALEVEAHGIARVLAHPSASAKAAAEKRAKAEGVARAGRITAKRDVVLRTDRGAAPL